MSAWIARTVAVAAIFAVVPLKGEAQTRKPMPREVATIRDCAKKYETNVDEAERQCLFNLVSTPCTDTPEGSSNVGTADCFRIEWKIWDDLLNENYQSLLADLDDEQAAKLRDMQRAWIAYRDATCGFYYVKIQGRMAHPMQAACTARETMRRALLLKFFTGL
jgi:uncharacterized protein YecT (DUF1311 family)